MMKSLFFTIAAITVFSLTTLICPAETEKVKPEKAETAPAETEQVKTEEPEVAADKTLVTVDGTEIKQSELDEEINKILEIWKSEGMPDAQAQQMIAMYKPQMIEGLIANILIENECDKKKISVSDEEITLELEEVEKALPEGQTLKEIMAHYKITEDKMKQRAGEQIKLKKLLAIDEPSEDEIKEFYENVNEEEVRARHILIMVEEDDTDEVKAEKKKKAEDIKKKITEGADFAELAKEYSDCPSKENGGDLGFFSKNRMVKPFSDAAFALDVDDVSDVVETRFGYHIIQTLEKKAPPTLDEARDNIKRAIIEQKIQKEAVELIEKLKEETDIVYTEKPQNIKDMLPTPLPESQE